MTTTVTIHGSLRHLRRLRRKVVLKMDMSLDGYVGPVDEDAEWIMRDFDDELSQWVVDEVLWQAGTHVMGRTTYEEMADYWPSADNGGDVHLVGGPRTI